VVSISASRTPAPAGASGRGRPRGNPRNTELRLLLLALVAVAGYAAVVEMHVLETVTATFWVPVVVLGAIFIGAHVGVRLLAPHADPVLLPSVALLNGIGVAFLRRLDLARTDPAERIELPALAGVGGQQLIWTLLAVAAAVVLLAFVRDHRVISRYAWTLGLVGLILMVIPGLLPASMSASEYDEAAKQWIRIGPFSIQPGEFAKLALAGFFAYYLVRKREVLSLASRRVLGIGLPRGRDLGPVIVVWMLSMLVLVWQFDLGMSLTYLGLFVAMLYIATERVSWLIIGFLLFSGGAATAYILGHAFGGPFRNLANRVDIWLDPFADPHGLGYQPVQGLLSLGTGGLFGTGPGGGQPTQVPEVHNDYIFAGIGEEIGLFGLTALLVVYLLIVTRGIKAGLLVRDSFGKLLAGGLVFTFGLQIFVILGGVGGLIPLTGLTTPFMSAGGSSLASNWLLIAVLLRISDAARGPATPSAPGGVLPPPVAVHAPRVSRAEPVTEAVAAPEPVTEVAAAPEQPAAPEEEPPTPAQEPSEDTSAEECSTAGATAEAEATAQAGATAEATAETEATAEAEATPEDPSGRTPGGERT
jgi:cell division protein FtsW (lipid II flippase)